MCQKASSRIVSSPTFRQVADEASSLNTPRGTEIQRKPANPDTDTTLLCREQEQHLFLAIIKKIKY